MLGDVGREIRQGEGGEAAVEDLLGFPHRLVERTDHRLEKQAARRFHLRGEGDDPLAERPLDLGEAHRRGGAREPPATAMPLDRAHDSGFPQAGERAADHHGVGAHAHRHLLGSHRPLRLLGHVQQDVQGGGEAFVSHHVTEIIT